MLNWGIAKNPLNWVIVFLMVSIGIILLNLLLTPWHIAQKGSIGLGSNSIPLDQPMTQ